MEKNFAYALIKERVIRECDEHIISFLKTQRAKTAKRVGMQRAGGWGDWVKGGKSGGVTEAHAKLLTKPRGCQRTRWHKLKRRRKGWRGKRKSSERERKRDTRRMSGEESEGVSEGARERERALALSAAHTQWVVVVWQRCPVYASVYMCVCICVCVNVIVCVPVTVTVHVCVCGVAFDICETMCPTAQPACPANSNQLPPTPSPSFSYHPLPTLCCLLVK